ncbi:MAG: PEP-utilizing enzyme [Patescibacteria group bacterium]
MFLTFCAINLNLEKLAKKFNYRYQDLQNLNRFEFIDLLKNKKLPDKKELQKRYNASVCWVIDLNKMKIFTGKEMEEFLKKNLPKEKLERETKIFKGNIAYSGKAIGRVKIVNSFKDVKKVKKGDILVSVQTMPSLLPAMKQAAAFVTDQGGITCHAAIVAREMKKPCVIGTKIAARVLRDGQLIEVDARRGIVRKI